MTCCERTEVFFRFLAGESFPRLAQRFHVRRRVIEEAVRAALLARQRVRRRYPKGAGPGRPRRGDRR